MPSFTLTDPVGIDHTLETNPDASVMNVAVRAGVPGIVAECGGCLSCHVYVAQNWMDRLDAPGDVENELLEELAAKRLPTSRLSCQLRLSDELDALEATVASLQP